MKKFNPSRIILVILLLAIICILLLLKECKSCSHPMTPVSSAVKKSAFICPPFPNSDISFVSYLIKNEKDTVIQLKSGSYIHIEPHTFVDDKGNVIDGLIQLQYREFQNATDFFSSGIPMTISMNSEKYHFESAGMFDIRGSYHSKPVYIDKAKPIHVSMAGFRHFPKFNHYYLDTIRKEWVEIKKNSIEADTTKKNVIAESTVHKIEPPVKPCDASTAKRLLHIDIANKASFPEFDDFPNLRFEVLEDHGQYYPTKEVITCYWPTIIPQEDKPGTYLLKMQISKKDSFYWISWLVRPAFEGDDLNKAMKIYEANLKRYQLELKKLEELKKAREMEEKRVLVMENLINEFRVQNFGIYNCDHPITLQWVSVYPKFQIYSGKKIRLNQVFVIDHKINGIIRFFCNDSIPIQIDPSSDQLYLGMGEDTTVFQLAIKSSPSAIRKNSKCSMSLSQPLSALQAKSLISKFKQENPISKI